MEPQPDDQPSNMQVAVEEDQDDGDQLTSPTPAQFVKTGYRLAKILVLPPPVPQEEDNDFHRVQRLAQNDKEFCRKLHGPDPFLRIVFWKWRHRANFDPENQLEEEAVAEIEKSIERRVELVNCQLHRLFRFAGLMFPPCLREELFHQARVEVAFMPPFLPRLPNCRWMRTCTTCALTREEPDVGHDPDYPALIENEDDEYVAMSEEESESMWDYL